MSFQDASGFEPRELMWPEERAELLIFLPLVFVAWSDGSLSEAELEALAIPIESQLWLDEEARDQVRAWFRPLEPPTVSSLFRARALILARAAAVPEEERRSLGSLGLAMARAGGAPDGPWFAPETRSALSDIEAALGCVGAEAVRDLLGTGAEPSPVEEARAHAALFDVGRMRTYLDQPHEDVRHRVLALLGEPGFQFSPDLTRTEYRERVLTAVRRLAEEGLGNLGYPEEFGGAGEPDAAVAVFETLALGDLSVLVKFGVQFGLFGGSVLQLGTKRHHELYLRRIASLDLPGGYAMTETAHGSNVRDLETLAVYDSARDGFVLDTPHDAARKDYIGNAALHGRMMTVFAQLEVGGEAHGVHAFLVPIRDRDGSTLDGIRIEDCGGKEGLNGVDNGRIWFDHVHVPRENLLDRFAEVTPDGEYHSPIPSASRRFFTMLGTLVAGRISIAAASTSATKRGLAVAVPYASTRRQFGPADEAERPIFDYLTHQRLLLPRLATTYALHFAVRDLTDRYRRGAGDRVGSPEAREVEALAAGLKAYASRHCTETLQACREACGGYGYLASNPLGRLKADTDVFTTFEGANPVLLQLLAKGLLSQFKDEMGDLRFWGIVRWVAERAQVRVSELNPVVTRRTDSEHLRDPEFHAAAFRYRADRLLGSAARRLKTLIDDGVETFEAMNLCQDHLVSMALAHVENHLLIGLQDAIKRAPTPGLSEILRTVGQLFALARLEEDRGWFLETGYFESAKSRAIRAEVNALCRELRPQACFLVDAFGVPDDLLGETPPSGG